MPYGRKRRLWAALQEEWADLPQGNRLKFSCPSEWSCPGKVESIRFDQVTFPRISGHL
jgi:hypothetical protein